MEKELQGSKIKPIHIMLFGAGTIAIMAITTAYVLWLGSANSQAELVSRPRPAITVPAAGGRSTVVSEGNVDEIRGRLGSPIEDGYYETRMNVNWSFPSVGEPSTNAYVENSPNNTRTVYFDLTLAETGELIYSSPFIPVGAKLEGFALDAHVPAGEHSGTVTYHLVDDDHQEITTVSVAVTLNILE